MISDPHLFNLYFIPSTVRVHQGGASCRTNSCSFLAGRSFHQETNRCTAHRIKASTSRQTRAMTDAVPEHGLAGTEVEVKLRIPDAASYETFAQALIPCFKQAHEQENWFFDGAGKELSAKRVVLRLRFYDTDRKAVITVKGAQKLEGGVGIAPEEEETVDPKIARGYLADPQTLLESSSPLIGKLKTQFGLKKGLVGLGNFHNLRKEYQWRGNLLELDQTSYPWGTLHELECETERPQELKKELEELLRSHGVPFSYTTKSKFANFVDKTLE